MWKFYTMECYSATKKKEFLLFAGKCMRLENIILCEINQVQKTKGQVRGRVPAVGGSGGLGGTQGGLEGARGSGF
jgi:hypothetical protein